MNVRLSIECTCKQKMCEHAEHELQHTFQDLYDDAYDDGWDAAFAIVHEMLKKAGLNPPDETPPPPERKSKIKRMNAKKTDYDM